MNLLPLDSWRRYFGYNPFHFFGLSNDLVPVTSACNTLIGEYAWQRADVVGRSEIREAIEAAETRLQEYLGYAVAPHYVVETYPFPHYSNTSLRRRGVSSAADGQMIPLNLREGYVQAVGIESWAAPSPCNLVISDADGDGLLDTFTTMVGVSVTNIKELGVYFQTADRVDDPDRMGEEDWRIRPVKITIAAGVATISGRAALVVKPELYEGVMPGGIGLDPNDVTIYVSQVNVRVHTTDPDGTAVTTAQATLLYEIRPCDNWWGCCDSIPNLTFTTNSNDPAAVGMAVARVGVRDARLGLVLPAQAVYDAVSGRWRAVDWGGFQEPDRVAVRYLAGYPLAADGNLDRKWRVIVARLAAAELARPICACDKANQELYHWQFDLSRAAGANDEQYSFSQADLDNPLGTRRGQVWAWKQVRNLRLAAATVV